MKKISILIFLLVVPLVVSACARVGDPPFWILLVQVLFVAVTFLICICFLFAFLDIFIKRFGFIRKLLFRLFIAELILAALFFFSMFC